MIDNDSAARKAHRKAYANITTKRKRTVTNLAFSKSDGGFIEACSKVGISPTGRQASKWRNKQGLAYNEGRK